MESGGGVFSVPVAKERNSVCVCISVHVWGGTCMQLCVRVHMCEHAHQCADMNMHACAHACDCTRTHVSACESAHILLHVCACVCHCGLLCVCVQSRASTNSSLGAVLLALRLWGSRLQVPGWHCLASTNGLPAQLHPSALPLAEQPRAPCPHVPNFQP